jgi:hypothetical protein
MRDDQPSVLLLRSTRLTGCFNINQIGHNFLSLVNHATAEMAKAYTPNIAMDHESGIYMVGRAKFTKPVKTLPCKTPKIC